MFLKRLKHFLTPFDNRYEDLKKGNVVLNVLHDFTAGLVAPTRSGGTGPLSRLAFPNRDDPNNADTRFHHESVIDRIRNAQRARLNRQRGAETLPRVQDAYGTLFAARSGETEVQALTSFLPETLDNSKNDLAPGSLSWGLFFAWNTSDSQFALSDQRGHNRLGNLIALSCTLKLRWSHGPDNFISRSKSTLGRISRYHSKCTST